MLKSQLDPVTEPRTYQKRILIDNAIIDNSKLPRTQRKKLTELARELNVPYQHVVDQAQRLRLKGLIPRPDRPRRTSTQLTPKIAVQQLGRGKSEVDTEALFALVEDKEIVDAEDRKKILSLIIKASTDEARIRAISLLESIESATVRQIGPPPPSNDVERASRLAILMKSVGRTVTDAALTQAFPPENPLSPAPSDSSVGGRSDGPVP